MRRPSRSSSKRTSGRTSAIRSSQRTMCEASVTALFRNFRRAGTRPNRSATSIIVPSAQATGPERSMPAPKPSTSVPTASSCRRVRMRTEATDAMLGSASPRKPSEVTRARSSAEASLLVACRSKDSRASSRLIPVPSSLTEIAAIPPSRITTRICVAMASSAFSTSSFTIEAGRSTTSPAAI